MITIAAAIIIVDGKVLMVRLPPGENSTVRWEFPGGEVGEGESPDTFLVQKLREKLGVEVAVGELIWETVQHCPDKPSSHLLAYEVKIASTKPNMIVDDRADWVSGNVLSQYRLSAVWTPVAERVAADLEDYYEKCAEGYFNATVAIDPEPFLSPIVKHLCAGSRILDVGSGCGRDLLWLKNHGFAASGFERSSKLAALARQYSGCPVIVGDFFHYDFSQIETDAILTTGALVHVARHRLAEVIIRILTALRAGGLLSLSLKEGAGEKRADDGRVFVLWRDDELRSIFAALHLEVVDFSRQKSSLRQDDTWLGYLLRHHNDSDRP